MTAVTPDTGYQPAAELAAAGQRQQARAVTSGRWQAYPLALICLAQAGLSLSLVWSNTAFGDEATYLWVGRVMIAHWLHGSSTPALVHRLSGSPVIYPPIAALADSAGGLAGARILSLLFMLGATVLLYLTAQRLAGRTAAVFGTAIWAFSEPVLRLAFATYDPLSVALTALSAWLVLQAGFRRRRQWLLIAAAVALALANATAFSGIVIDPVVIVFAFAVWQRETGAGRALRDTGLFIAEIGACIVAGLTLTQSWAGTSAIFNRQSADHQSLALVLDDVWKYSGLVILLALAGVVIALLTERRGQALLFVFLGLTSLVVPVAQLKFHTAWSLDKHLAYGIWFAAIAVGYGVSRLVGWLPGLGKLRAAACCVLLFAYPAINGWQAAWSVFHSWANASSFVSSFRPAAARSHGLLYTASQVHVAEYYTPAIRNWSRWNESALPLDPSVPRASWPSYYASQLRKARYGAIALFYVTSFSSSAVTEKTVLSPSVTGVYQQLLGLIGTSSGQPGLPALTVVLQHDRAYRLVAVGPYDSSVAHGYYAIWRKVAGP
jgi:hypothetical protein